MSTLAPHRPLLTVAETAERLRVSEKTVRRLVGRAELPALRVGGQIRVDSSELERWLYGPAVASQISAGRAVPEVAGKSTSAPPAGRP